MDSTTLVGNLCRDPELQYTQSGKARCRLSIALDLPPTRDGSERDPEFRNVTVWDRQAENVAESLTKGCRVVIVAHSRTWKRDVEIDGEARTIDQIEYVATHIGPELRFATAEVTRNPKDGHAQGNQRRRPEQDDEPRPARRQQQADDGYDEPAPRQRQQREERPAGRPQRDERPAGRPQGQRPAGRPAQGRQASRPAPAAESDDF